MLIQHKPELGVKVPTQVRVFKTTNKSGFVEKHLLFYLSDYKESIFYHFFLLSARDVVSTSRFVLDMATTEFKTTVAVSGSEEEHFGQLDQGLRAWTVVFGAWCCLFCAFGWVNAIGIFQEYYQNNQLHSYSASSISWILSLEPFVLFAAGIVIGRVFDNYGPKWLLLIGTCLHVFGIMMTSISTEYYQFLLAQGICSPLGASFVFSSALSCTATWFEKRRALAFGTVSSGSSLGGVVFPTMLSRLLPSIGLGWSLRISGFIILALLVIANLTVRSRIRNVPRPVKLSDYTSPFSENEETTVELTYSAVSLVGFYQAT
ncbi:hypothetical protein VN97_g3370 [Penicillium thymicola]|uniref:Major facilitator superfamily (MFS) profile domain-containing protein n=1 Tax=Penicillium thymicola TaxID=293382 RepID=A0AAI9XAL6_PENTH|nr:hypothetical protein VN97_g3370 [Penicillium thymicola]